MVPAFPFQPSTAAPLPTEQLFDDWYAEFAANWQQGQHVVLIGQTGAGKTSLARDILAIRDYVIVLAVKRDDDVLDTFRPRYRLIRKWPPDYDVDHAVIWLRPKNLAEVGTQALQVYHVLDGVFTAGGWAIYVDDTGYITGTLRLSQQLVVLLNQGRSSGISVVSAMTQPSSVISRIPSETLRQTRHKLVFAYFDEPSIKAIAAITGRRWRDIEDWMKHLGTYDFLAFSHRNVVIVRHTAA